MSQHCHFARESQCDNANHYIGGGMWVCFRHWLLLFLPPSQRRTP